MAHVSYEYSSLNLDRGEIRLLTLLPGEFDDPVRISLHHAILQIPDNGLPETGSVDLDTLRKTLPPGWNVDLTFEGRVLFFQPEGQNRTRWHSQWTHPDPSHEQEFEVPGQPLKLHSDQPEFEALSYCWGPSSPREHLIIVPHDGGGSRATPELDARDPLPTKMSVQQNLIGALRHLRYPSQSRTLWVDAICINQGDLAERGRHVARMGSIYELASRVVAWLGPETDSSLLAMNTLESLGMQLEMLSDINLPSPAATHPEWLANYPCNDRTIRALRSLLNDTAWFQRLWIWQEIVLANNTAIMQCGAKVADWYNIRRGLVVLRETTLPDARMRKGLIPNPLLYLPYIFRRTMKRWDSISKLLLATSHSGYADPRDKIYALLGMCDPQLAKHIVPDYTLTPSQIYKDATLKFAQQHQSLILLQYCDLHLRKMDGPTWVPDWTSTAVRPWQLAYASALCKAELSLPQPEILGVLGVRAGQVLAISSSNWMGYEYPTTVAEAFEIIKDWYGTWLRSVPSGTPLEEFISAVRYGWVWERRRAGQSAKAYSEEFLQLIAGEPSEEELSRSEFIQDVIRDEKTCSFFCTTLGQPGMGPIGTKPGDLVAVLLGSPYPLVLRPADNGRFQVVGPAFVQGLMDGEAVLGQVPKPWAIKIEGGTPKGDIWTCYDDEKGVVAPEDVRLGELPVGWRRVGDGVFSGPEGAVGEDPRLGPGYLRSRGVQLETLELV